MTDRSQRLSFARPLTRRDFTRAIAWTGLGTAALGLAPFPSEAAPPAPKKLLDESSFVYISPLKRDGGESSCHGELWYAWLEDAVVVIVATDRWKATAIRSGLDRARIWVGDHGLWRTWYGGRNEDFRKAPNFVAKGQAVKDRALLDRLLERYETKYPAEIADWRDKMRSGYADGSRTLIRYTATS